VLKLFGIDTGTLTVAVCLFLGIGVATWGYHLIAEQSRQESERDKAAAEKARQGEKKVQDLLIQSRQRLMR
jgi:hypothetical protein